jgi:mono/diheme cytochrome c family protein
LLTVCLACETSVQAVEPPSLKFLAHGKPVKTLSLKQLRELAAPQQLTVWEPHENREVTYEGFPARALLERVYGKRWRAVAEIIFLCTDGYRPVLARARFDNYDALFAIRRTDQAEFTLVNRLQGDEHVDLGPFYLVWDNRKQPALKAQKGEGWPYQVVAMDLVDFQDRFPHVIPPKDATVLAQRGFDAFRQHCLSCHGMNGEGGGKGKDLNRPVSAIQQHSEAWLKRWMLDPGAMMPGTAMPALSVLAGPDADHTADAIIAYLKAMAPGPAQPSQK